MKKYFLLVGGMALFISLVGFLFFKEQNETSFTGSKKISSADKIYIAAEGDSAISIIDADRQEVIGSIDLSIEHKDGRLPYYPHNVQTSPDGKTIWVTANAGKHEEHSWNLLPQAYAHSSNHEQGEEKDELVVIDPTKEKIIRRIPIEKGLSLAHVVIDPKSTYAYVTAQKGNAIFKVSVATHQIEKRIDVPLGSEPHGLRISSDGSKAYIAMTGREDMGVLDLSSDELTFINLGDKSVQTAVTPDGRIVAASLYASTAISIMNTANNEVSIIDLPIEAQGPVQIYPTPDSQFLYVADQGYYFEKSVHSKVYKIDLNTMQVVAEIESGQAPHGVVVSPDGRAVYVTNLLEDSISVIDIATDQRIAVIKVGKEPNGITYWQNSTR